MSFEHTSVLLYECLGELQIRSNGIYVDGTLGGAGHSYEIARKLRGDGRLIGIDRDIAAIEAASAKLEPVREKVQIVRDNYGNIPQIIKNLGYTGVDGILLDLGVSSHQLDTPERGFTYMQEASLDMRMDDRQTLTAKDIVNTYSQRDLTRIIRDYGEDHFAANIAKHIVKNREMKPIETTMELNEIIKAAIPAKVRATGGHPSKRTYQAIRIECNRELEVLQESIDALIMSLNVGGRLCIITFHSLEDRIVKSAFRKNENPCTCPPEFPVCVCHQVSRGRVVTRKPILPGEAELEANKRSQSAKLRVFERA